MEVCPIPLELRQSLSLLDRFIMSLAVADHSSQDWFQGFNDVGEAIFGMNGNDVVALKVRKVGHHAEFR